MQKGNEIILQEFINNKIFKNPEFLLNPAIRAFFNFSNDSMKSSPSNTEEPFSMSSDISIEQRSSKEDFV